MGNGLILVAASGLALETAEAARACGIRIEGCVDDDATLWGSLAGGWLKVLGGLDSVAAQADCDVIVCAGRGVVRELLTERLRELGVADEQYATVVHPSVSVPDSCTVGAGSVVLAGAVLTAAVSVGRHVVVMPHVTMTHDDVIEDFATLCAGVTLGGGVRVGRAAYLGMASSVREKVTVGARGTLGMGAVLLRDLPGGEVWAGVPARPLVNSQR
ncbi:acetyltransferase [Pedococcus bigeumensis]|uniref:Acetyltransferase n=1 Tax=Pedococcus bigeumensis TaxID=433644 RepID=A0A502CMK1_9MICO|nr:acetyltransferase [Pedococcus bigeumensis]